MTIAFPNTKFQVSAGMVRTLCMALCVVMVLSFALIGSTEVAFCSEVETPTEPAGDPATALTDIGTAVANVIYKGIRSLVTPLVILAFAIAGLQFFFGGNQGTEKAKKWILGACAGFVLVVFTPVIGQFLALQFQNWGSGDLYEYNPL